MKAGGLVEDLVFSGDEILKDQCAGVNTAYDIRIVNQVLQLAYLEYYK